MQQLRLLPLAVTLLAAVTVALLVLVLTLGIDALGIGLGQPEESAGYVACDTTWGIGKAGEGCIPPDSSTPKENIVYCRTTSEEDVESFDSCSNVKPGS
jgi:hypothetical protein